MEYIHYDVRSGTQRIGYKPRLGTFTLIVLGGLIGTILGALYDLWSLSWGGL